MTRSLDPDAPYPYDDSKPVRSGIPGRTWTIIVILALVGQIAWAVENNFFNLFIQDVFGASLSHVALMVSASALTATATTLLVGAWSDRIGRRKVFVVVGSLLWGLSICAFAVLQNASDALARDAAAAASLGITLTIIFDCIMTFFGSTANDACFNAWLTDITNDTNRGKVEGVNSAMPLLSMLVVFGGAMFLMIVGSDGSVTYDYSLFFTIIGAVVIVAGIVAAFMMEDSHPERRPKGGFLKSVAYGFTPAAMRENKALYLLLVTFCIFAIGMQVIMPYYVLYLRLPYILGENYVFVMAPCIIIAAVFTIVYARQVDKHGFNLAIIVPFGLFIIGCIVLAAVKSAVMVFVGSALLLSGYLSGAACFGAEIRNRTPVDRVGLFQGLRIFMIVLVPMLIGPWLGSLISTFSANSAIVSLGFGVVGDGFTPSSLIFALAAPFAALAWGIIKTFRKSILK